tara:strand:+ start:177 stop:371 length:195 start_codon:yes stop_codon:yes gene_type:complete
MAHDEISDRELRLECLKLVVTNSATSGIRDPLQRAEEFLAWCNPRPEKPAATAQAPGRRATAKK